ncbi:hypothetical protein [Neisseria chenwenguii]|uniref:hypothetical protein n=1 Tax=Neisseria chenwenguii TaxID=1853278 RepID=UPI000F4EE70F|nr:hypothetical protein [Neisseria chenwenguii]
MAGTDKRGVRNIGFRINFARAKCGEGCKGKIGERVWNEFSSVFLAENVGLIVMILRYNKFQHIIISL